MTFLMSPFFHTLPSVAETLPSIDLREMLDLARRASRAILDVYYTDFEVTNKEDRSPLTKADEASNNVIIAGLTARYPNIPVVSEESEQTVFAKRRDWELLWLIDPLDGTREFIQRNGEFTINIALVSHQVPIWGMIYIPVSGQAYYASRGGGAYRLSADVPERISTTEPGRELVIAASRSHYSANVDKYVMPLRRQFDRIRFISAGSALKFCLLAEGRAHIYPRFGTTMEWDTAAGQVLVEEAGGRVLNMDTHAPLTYNKSELSNPSFVGMGTDLTPYLPMR